MSARGDTLTHEAHATLRDNEPWHEHDRKQSETPIEDDHRDERGDDSRRVTHNARHKRGEDAGNSAHVVLKPRLNDARLGPSEERQLHVLQSFKEAHP